MFKNKIINKNYIIVILLYLTIVINFLNIYANNECKVWTDKSVYHIGETVTIYIEPKPALGVDWWLQIYYPDGTLYKKIDTELGKSKYTIVAPSKIGIYKIELWKQIITYPRPSPEVCSVCYFKVITDNEISIIASPSTVEIEPDSKGPVDFIFSN
ncbi:MAG: hypothetical protein LWW95_11265, partial [Candidatus Desulfofervidus auxilii]|nr:hypothetical protein [Candidatus Desulfofervidus auxilii]